MPDATRSKAWFQQEYIQTFHYILAPTHKFIFYKTDSVTKTSGGREKCSFFVSGLHEFIPQQIMSIETDDGKLIPFPDNPETSVEPSETIVKPDSNPRGMVVPSRQMLKAKEQPHIPIVSPDIWCLIPSLNWLNPAEKVWDPTNKQHITEVFEEKGIQTLLGEYNIFDKKAVDDACDQDVRTIVCW